MKNVNRIIRMRDYSLRVGGDGSARGFILKWREKLHKQGVRVDVKLDKEPRGAAVLGYIHQGQWVAECECGGHEFVDPADPLFFCWGCVNRANDGYLRPVVIPPEWEAIEALILERPVEDARGATDLERAALARPKLVTVTDEGEYPLVRSWKPGESLGELQKQNSVLNGATIKEREVLHVDLRSKRERD